MPVTVVLHPVHVAGLSDLLAGVPGIGLELPADADGVADAVAHGADVLVTYLWEDRFGVATLRWVQSISAGIEQFPTGEMERSGTVLTSARGAHSPAVAEHAIALLLALTRNVGPAVRDAVTRSWTTRPGYEIAGRTLGVLGLGAIGEEVARRGVALGMRVIGTKRRPGDYAGVAEAVYGPGETTAVCAASDAVVVTLPHGAGDGTVVGAEGLAALGSGWLVNVGRGSVVDEAALIEALTSGALRGAGLDVFGEEPLPESSPLWSLPNVIITPHVAWASDRLAGRLARLFANNLAAYRGEASWVNRIV